MQSPIQPPRRTTRGLTSVAEAGPVASLAKKARELDELDRKLRQTLPTPLRDQVRFADLRDGRLVFLAPSSAWAAKLRMYQAQILSSARALGAPAGSVTVKVAPLPPEEIIPDRHKPLSTSAARHLKAAAASLSDPVLKSLFLELASHAENPGESDT
ncbi:hypothetical protein EC912_10438 [Luteibacter rhizovicinus]|uniref:DUF721 domain-containing protein n=1 Tax=Luteibacter rhizovicinus TaxID=242606 RepID=A0A4R3YRG2_9GAMM|nr:DUF721 domain-containing protein [Luteibacter rhizovicinus]TCV93844.1 hypothetical protein EC912_10438 [Luteibacter rhizovicinus]